MERFLITALMLVSASAVGQSFKIGEDLYVGGGFGLNFANGVTTFGVSPHAAYKLTEEISSGLRLTYQYTDVRFSDVSINSYGVAPFFRYQFGNALFAWIEYEYLRASISEPSVSLERQGINYDSFLVGGGISQPLGRTVGMNFMVLYNLFWADGTNQPYFNPVIVRATIDVGF